MVVFLSVVDACQSGIPGQPEDVNSPLPEALGYGPLRLINVDSPWHRSCGEGEQSRNIYHVPEGLVYDHAPATTHSHSSAEVDLEWGGTGVHPEQRGHVGDHTHLS